MVPPVSAVRSRELTAAWAPPCTGVAGSEPPKISFHVGQLQPGAGAAPAGAPCAAARPAERHPWQCGHRFWHASRAAAGPGRWRFGGSSKAAEPSKQARKLDGSPGRTSLLRSRAESWLGPAPVRAAPRGRAAGQPPPASQTGPRRPPSARPLSGAITDCHVSGASAASAPAPAAPPQPPPPPPPQPPPPSRGGEGPREGERGRPGGAEPGRGLGQKGGGGSGGLGMEAEPPPPPGEDGGGAPARGPSTVRPAASRPPPRAPRAPRAPGFSEPRGPPRRAPRPRDSPPRK